MKDLSPLARTLLLRARDAGAPSAVAKARVEQALSVRLASPLGAGALAGAGKAAIGTSMTMKGLVVAGLAGVATLAGLELATPDAPRISELTPAVATAAAPATLPTTRSVATAEVAAPAAEAPPNQSTDRKRRSADVRANPSEVAVPPTPSERRDAHRGSSPARVADFAGPAAQSTARERVGAEGTPAPFEGADSFGEAETRTRLPAKADLLAAETLGLREIQRALREGHGELALELLSRDRGRYAKGVLHQERAAARIQALCLLGRAEAARTEAATFEERWPRSPLLARVRSACR